MAWANLFIDRENGTTSRVERVTEHGARITVLTKLTSTWFMPLADYDTIFVKRFVPLDVGQMQTPEDFRMPANADYWDREKEGEAEAPADLDGERGETPVGVRIGTVPPAELTTTKAGE